MIGARRLGLRLAAPLILSGVAVVQQKKLSQPWLASA
jgi:hypothetical protein